MGSVRKNWEGQMNWKSIETAPKWDGKTYILCGFKGQFGWVYYTALANGQDSSAPGFAKPTHWCNIDDPDQHGSKESDM